MATRCVIAIHISYEVQVGGEALSEGLFIGGHWGSRCLIFKLLIY